MWIALSIIENAGAEMSRHRWPPTVVAPNALQLTDVCVENIGVNRD